jgi:hypothetical protein
LGEKHRYRLSVISETGGNTVTVFVTHDYRYPQHIFDALVEDVSKNTMPKVPYQKDSTREERKLRFLQRQLEIQYGFKADEDIVASHTIRLGEN